MTFDWNDEKNEELKEKRNISFEEIVICINEGRIIDVLSHPNKKRYPNQQLYLVRYRNYVYVVPFVRDPKKQQIFLKTIYPSRSYTEKYKKKGQADEKESI